MIGNILLTFSFAFWLVPIQDIVCRQTGAGGNFIKSESDNTIDQNFPDKPQNPIKRFTVNFASGMDRDAMKMIDLKPSQSFLEVNAGEVALAFFTAENKLDKDLAGIALQHIEPEFASKQIHKIQCFCFEEQQIRKGEKVDFPVLFVLDPDILNDEDFLEKDEDDLTFTQTFQKSDDEDIPWDKFNQQRQDQLRRIGTSVQ